MESDVLLPTEATRQWLFNLWRAAGSEAQEAQLTADHLVGANLAGHDSHGVSMAGPYVRSLRANELQLNQRLSIVTDTETLLVVDGNRGIGQSMAYQTMQLAIERARQHGVVIVACATRITSVASGIGQSRPSRQGWHRYTSPMW